MNFFSNNKTNQSQEETMKAQHDQELNKFGAKMESKAEDAKDSVVDEASTAMGRVAEQNRQTNEKLQEKMESVRSWTADKLDGLQGTIAPPEPEPKTIGEKLNEKVSGLKEAAISPFQKEEEPKEPNFEDDKKLIKEKLSETAENARSWTAEKVMDIQEVVQPPVKEEEPGIMSKIRQHFRLRRRKKNKHLGRDKRK